MYMLVICRRVFNRVSASVFGREYIVCCMLGIVYDGRVIFGSHIQFTVTAASHKVTKLCAFPQVPITLNKILKQQHRNCPLFVSVEWFWIFFYHTIFSCILLFWFHVKSLFKKILEQPKVSIVSYFLSSLILLFIGFIAIFGMRVLIISGYMLCRI